jgi:hypothetical protein
MPSLDFVSNKDQSQKKGINLVTLIATILFLGALGFAGFVGYKYWDNTNVEKELQALRSEQTSVSYQKAKAFYGIQSQVSQMEKSYLRLGALIEEIKNKTDEGVVYDSITYSSGVGGGELKLKGIFKSVDIIEAQIVKYQGVTLPVDGKMAAVTVVVTIKLEGENKRKEESQYAQGATITFLIP